jgi:hypothetical protein
MNDNHFDTTRYLCAAAEMNRSFRNQVMEEILHNTHRYVAPCYGVDIGRVVWHCVQAKRRDFILLLILLGIFAWAFLSSFETGFFFFLPYFFTNLFFSYPILLAFGAIFITKWIGYRRIIKSLLRQNYRPGLPDAQMNDGMLGRLAQLKGVQEGNVVYYSGFSPFVGSGIRVSGWSFVIDIRGDKAEAFTLRELYDRIEEKIRALHIPGMSCSDRLFVDGKNIRNDRRFLENEFSAPFTQVAPSLVEEYVEKFGETIRHYKVIQVVGWKGDFVLSAFLRFVKSEENLFVEVNYYILPPLQNKYYAIDRLSKDIPLDVIGKLVFQSVIQSFILLPLSPVHMMREIKSIMVSKVGQRKIAKEIRDNQMFDYGAGRSIREMAATDNFRYFFQRSDYEMYRKQIERRLLESIIEFLDGKGIDISEFKARQDTIINNGILVTNGSFQADNVAVGKNSTVWMKEMANM